MNSVLYYPNLGGGLITVSFIVVALNAAGHLPGLLTDLNNQTYPHERIEVILIDSMSNDGTRSLMEDFSSEGGFKRVIIRENPEKRLPQGWNIALSEAEGQIIVRLDAHARMDIDFIRNIVKNIEDGEDIVGGQRITTFQRDNRWQKILSHAEQSVFGSGIAKYRRLHQRQYVKTLAHAAYRREVFEATGRYDERLLRTEDNDMHYRMGKKGFRFCLCPDIISYHHVRSTLEGMLKQKYLNGWWIGLTLGVQPKCFSLYHFIPLLFTLALLAADILTIWSPLPILLLLLCYFAGAIAATVYEMASGKEDFITRAGMLLLPFLFFMLHLFYGLGTLLGILYMPFWKIKIKKNRKN